MTSAIDAFLDHPVWCDTHRSRLIPLGETAQVRRHGRGEILFKRFHPADQLLLLREGSVAHETGGDSEGGSWPMGNVAWPWAALGWSGFLPQRRNGTTARTLTPVELVSWEHDNLARSFYSDPLLAVSFFRIVLDSVRRQFEWIRGERLAAQSRGPVHDRPPAVAERHARQAFAPGIITALRRSAFFAQFDDAALQRLAANAELTRCDPGTELVAQGEFLDGLWVLAGGSADSFFSTREVDGGGLGAGHGGGGGESRGEGAGESRGEGAGESRAEGAGESQGENAGESQGERLVRFLSLPARGGVAAGVPTVNGGFRAEATVRAVSPCWFYRIPTESIESLIKEDPEFGRSFAQRQLTRLSHLIAAARVPKPSADEEPEIVALKSVLHQNQARIPVTSELHKVPHLLAHRLTTRSALASLGNVRGTGSYAERAVARVCSDMLAGVQAEVGFYEEVLNAYAAVTDVPEDSSPAELRGRCDRIMNMAFSHLRTEIRGREHLPESPGHIAIINHLCCPAYYQLPNDYHFSFDTAFVSVLLRTAYGESPVRVVRQSPGVEYGHNLFYSRLGHITVPTLESGIETTSPDELERLRREAAEEFFRQGRAAIRRGENVLICPEGQCQKSVNSPARFYSGAFRLALKTEPEPYIVPIAIAGFDRRFKDVRLVALVQPPFLLSEAMARQGTDDLREFLDDYRARFASAVKDAQRLSRRA